MKYPRIYNRLKAYGFSPFKAAEIILDAQRRDRIALMALRIAFFNRHDDEFSYANLRAQKNRDDR